MTSKRPGVAVLKKKKDKFKPALEKFSEKFTDTKGIVSGLL